MTTTTSVAYSFRDDIPWILGGLVVVCILSFVHQAIGIDGPLTMLTGFSVALGLTARRPTARSTIRWCLAWMVLMSAGLVGLEFLRGSNGLHMTWGSIAWGMGCCVLCAACGWLRWWLRQRHATTPPSTDITRPLNGTDNAPHA